MGRDPFDLFCRLLDLLRIDAHKPLSLGEYLYGCLASPAQAHILLQGLLFEYYPLLLHIPDDPLLGLVNRAAGIGPSQSSEPSLPVYGLAQRQVMLHPPSHVLPVSKGADHDYPCAEGSVHHRIGQDRHLIIKQGNPDLLAYETLIALVIGMNRHGHAGREKLGPGGGYLHLTIRGDKAHIVEVGGAGVVFHFGEGYGRTAAGTPVDRMVIPVDLSTVMHANK